MSYISELRKYIGHQPIINIGATIIVLNDKNEILLNLRSDTDTWGIIGGGMELGENLEVLEGGNLKVLKAGTYTFTIDKAGKVITYTVA